jgi:hypothetical protein
VRIALAVVVTLALGCGRPVEAELLEVRSVSPDRVQTGHRLSIDGHGFPAGRAARVRWSGTLHRPGRPARAVDVELEGRARDAEHVEVAMPASALRALGGRGTFRGSIRLAFGSGPLGGDVVGSIEPVAIDLLPADAPARSDFAERIGVTLGPPEDEEPGAIVAAVEAGSRAESAGLAVGDRVVGMGGLRILAPEDLVPPPEERRVGLDVARGEQTFGAVLDIQGLDESVPAETILLFQLAALGWLLALVWLGPAAAWVDRLAPAAASRRAWIWVLAAALVCVGVRRLLDAAPRLGVEAVVLALAAGRGAVVVLSSAPGTRWLAALRAGGGALALAAVLFATTLAVGTSSAAALEAAQGPLPWEWAALRSPAGALGALLTVVAAACGPVATRAGGWRRRALDDAFLVALAACAAIALAGGAAATTRLGDVRPALAWIGWVPFAATGAAIAVVLRRARDAAAPTGPLALASMVVASLATLAAVGWAELEVGAAVERAIGEVLVALALAVALRIATARPIPPARPLHATL